MISIKKITHTLPLMVLLITSLSSQAQAQYETEDTYRDMYAYAAEFSQNLNNEQLSQKTSYKLSTAEVSDECIALMNASMFTGPLGASIAGAFVRNPNDLALLHKGGSMNRYCPRYKKMTQKQKSMVWVLTLTAMAHFESSCNSKAKNPGGPNGTAYGLFQLHRNHEAGYDGAEGLCKNGDSNSTYRSAVCTLSMLNQQFKARNGELFSQNSYWCVLRPRGESAKAGQIRKAIQRSSLCNPKTI